MAQNVIDVDPNIDWEKDSAFNGSIGDTSYTTSVTSSVFHYTYENGRRYNAFREGEYIGPNDETEQDRMDLTHHIYRLILGVSLHLAPLKPNPSRVLDLGTGTGIWAIDIADEYPSAQVIGTDLSPIQPSWQVSPSYGRKRMPPNCSFQISDFDTQWAFSSHEKFDFIHARDISGCVSDYGKFFSEAYDHLVPGGYLEMQSQFGQFFSDDGTDKKATAANQWQALMIEAAEKFGKPLRTEFTWAEKMAAAGFTEIEVKVYKVPQAPWAKDPAMKELGRYQQVAMLQMVEAFSLALFTRVLKWDRLETEVLLANVRNEIKDKGIHLYGKVIFVYGKRPKQFCSRTKAK